MTSNEIRQVIGMKPSDDPKADQLINSNINQSNKTVVKDKSQDQIDEEGGKNQNG